MGLIHKYPSMDNYYKSVGDMLGDRVYITEKLDGSNFSVRLVWNRETLDFDVEYRSRNQKVNQQEGSLFHEAILIVENSLLEDMKKYALDGVEHAQEQGMVFYFEIIGRGVQKRVNYSSYLEPYRDETVITWPVINGRTIVLIDVCSLYAKMDSQELHREWFIWPRICSVAKYLGVPVPAHGLFDKLTMEHIEILLEDKDIEGWVLRAETPDQVLYTHYGDLKRVKLKTNWFDSFEKKAPRNKRAKPKTPPEVIEFLMERINFGRLHSVYSHGHEELVYDMKDMKYLIDLVVEDIKGEDDSLWEQFDADIIRKTAARMLPKTLKGYLLERNSGDE